MSTRQGFEVWYATTYPEPMGPTATSPAAKKRAIYLKNALFIAWQASRESMVVELPKTTHAGGPDDEIYWPAEIYAAMETAGLKVTP